MMVTPVLCELIVSGCLMPPEPQHDKPRLQDALLLLVRPDGPACHTGAVSCFYRRLDGEKLTRIGT